MSIATVSGPSSRIASSTARTQGSSATGRPASFSQPYVLGTLRNHGSSGSNGARNCGMPVAERAPSVVP